MAGTGKKKVEKKSTGFKRNKNGYLKVKGRKNPALKGLFGR